MCATRICIGLCSNSAPQCGHINTFASFLAFLTLSTIRDAAGRMGGLLALGLEFFARPFRRGWQFKRVTDCRVAWLASNLIYRYQTVLQILYTGIKQCFRFYIPVSNSDVRAGDNPMCVISINLQNYFEHSCRKKIPKFYLSKELFQL